MTTVIGGRRASREPMPSPSSLICPGVSTASPRRRHPHLERQSSDTTRVWEVVARRAEGHATAGRGSKLARYDRAIAASWRGAMIVQSRFIVRQPGRLRPSWHPPRPALEPAATHRRRRDVAVAAPGDCRRSRFSPLAAAGLAAWIRPAYRPGSPRTGWHRECQPPSTGEVLGNASQRRVRPRAAATAGTRASSATPPVDCARQGCLDLNPVAVELGARVERDIGLAGVAAAQDDETSSGAKICRQHLFALRRIDRSCYPAAMAEQRLPSPRITRLQLGASQHRRPRGGQGRQALSGRRPRLGLGRNRYPA